MAVRDILHDDRTTRPAIFALVLAVHLAVFLVPVRHRYDTVELPAPSSLRLIENEPGHRPLSSIQDASPPAIAVESPAAPRLAPFQLPDAGSPAGAATTLPDWKQSGAEAAADAARDNYRALGPRPHEPTVKLPPSPFAPPPRHQFGEADEDALKNPILWLGEHCFARPENFAALAGDPFASVPMIFCNFSIGKKAARGDLFEHLRKPQPVP